MQNNRKSEECIRISLADFEPPDGSLAELVIDFIDSQRKRLYIKERKSGMAVELPDDIQLIYCLCLFNVSLDQGGYTDRTQTIAKMEYHVGFFWKYKTLLIHGLEAVDLALEAEKLDYYFTGSKISQESETTLEDSFWNSNFKRKFEPILIGFLESQKEVLLSLQEF